MRYEIVQPCLQLQPYVKNLVVSEADNAQLYRIMPDTALVMGFQYHGSLTYIDSGNQRPLAASGITGLLDNYRIFQNSADTGSILVAFNETGASSFLSAPANEVFRQSVSLQNFFKAQQLRDVEERLCNATTDAQRIGIIQNFLIKNLTVCKPDLLVKRAVQLIYQTQGNIRVGKLAQELCISESPLEKRFRALVGASPKKFARIVRTRSVLNQIAQTGESLSDFLSAYYDQAHFIKEFKAFTSQTPMQYLKTLRDTNNK